MSSSTIPTLPIEQHWAQPAQPTDGRYRPALLLECQMKFHHLRARAKHTVERYFTAWYPKGHTVADWDVPAFTIESAAHLSIGPTRDLPYLTDGYVFTREIFDESIDTLLDRLARTERLRIFHNPSLDVFSEPEETREQFIERLSEKAFETIEDELTMLVRRAHLKLSQVREAHERRGMKLDIPDTFLNNILMEYRSKLFASQARLESLFMSGERLVVTSDEPSDRSEVPEDPDYRELQETLRLIENEAKRDLNELCTRCIQRASECDSFEIGLQPNQINVLRKGVLWVPIA